MSDVISGVGFQRPFWPRLPWLQPLDGSLLLKFSVKTRLKSESFEPLKSTFWGFWFKS